MTILTIPTEPAIAIPTLPETPETAIDGLTITGSERDDRLTGSAQGDSIEGLGGDDVIKSGDGDDFVHGGEGDDRVEGGDGDDLIEGGAGADRLEGNRGDDTIHGGEGDDQIFGGDGKDMILGGAGNDRIEGNQGDDRINAGAGDDHVEGGDGDDVVIGGDGNDRIEGNGGDDWLMGDAGDDDIRGGDGHDTVEGGAGADRLNGGDGYDAVSYATSNASVHVNLATSTASGGHAEGDVISRFESIIGSTHDDRLVGDNGSNTIRGGFGDDVIAGRGGVDMLYGQGGDDTFNVDTRYDTRTNFDGGTGTDAIRIFGRSETANFRNDSFVDVEALSIDASIDRRLKFDAEQFGFEAVSIDASAALRTTKVTFDIDMEDAGALDLSQIAFTGTLPTDEVIISGTGRDETIAGSSIADTIDGRGGDDAISGGAGDDDIRGGDGHDLIEGGAGADDLNGGDGKDTLSYAGSDEAVFVDMDAETASGGDAAGDTFTRFENLTGSAQGDMLVGTRGVNEIRGGAGDDLIAGLSGKDTLFGEDGDDTFEVDARADARGVTYDGGAGIDTIRVSGPGGAKVFRDDSITDVERLVFDDARDGKAVFFADQFNFDEVAVDISGAARASAITQEIHMGDAVRLDLSQVAFTNASLADKVEVYGDNDAEVIIGSSISDKILGRGGDDQIEGGDGDDRLEGNGGDDFIVGGDGEDLIFGGDGKDALLGGAGDDRIEGNGGDDLIIGGTGDDLINGGDGDDFIIGGAGADDLNGGDGADTLSYSISLEGVFVNLATSIATGGDATGDTIKRFENIVGSDNDDLLIGDNGANEIRGGDGDDLILGGRGGDRLDGGRGNDLIDLGDDGARDVLIFAEGYGDDRAVGFQQGRDQVELDDALFAGRADIVTGRDVVDAFGSFSDDGRALTLDFDGGDSLTLISTDGFDAATFGADLLIG